MYEGVAEQPTTDPRFQFGEGSSSRQKAVANKLAEQDKGHLERNVGQRQMRSVAAGTANSIGNMVFRAAGTNQSVNQLVVISGELQSDTNQTAAARNRGLSNGNSSSQAVTLRGKASIGRNLEMPIEASGTAR